MNSKHRVLLSIVSAILLIFTYPGFNFEFLAWIAFIPLFFALENNNIKERFLKGYLFGIVFFSGVLYWLFGISVPGAAALILVLALAPAIFSLLYSSAARRPLLAVILVPSAWVSTEYLRAHLFTGFPWALLGYSQSLNLYLIQIADITGVYGVSFLIVLFNFGVYLALRKHPARRYVLFFIFALFILALSYGHNKTRVVYPAQKLKVAVIQGNIAQEMKWDPRQRGFIIDRYKALTKAALKEDPHLVIWPETSLPGYLEEYDLKSEITGFARSNKTHLLLGTLRESRQGTYNSATFISDEGDVLGNYDKIHLVPFGEFVPFGRVLAPLRSFIDKPMGDFARGRDFTVFKFRLRRVAFKPRQIRATTRFYEFAALICYEDIFPELSRNFVRKGARFLVNITNDAWFGRTAAPFQHAQGSVFRAIENRVPVIRAANTGVSCIIDHNGKVSERVASKGKETFVEGYAVGIVLPTFVKTFYGRFGDVFAWACIALVLSGVLGAGFFAIKLKFGKKSFILALLLASAVTVFFAARSEGEVHYRSKFKFPFAFGKKCDYNNVLVTRVIDGDTIEIQGRERIRLIGIDTPETWFGPKLERDSRRTGKDQRTIIKMGEKAARFTKSLAEGKRVKLEFDVEKKDRYGRSLAYVYLPDGKMLNAEILKEGYGQVYTFQPNVKYVDLFLKLQREARENKRGLWGEE